MDKGLELENPEKTLETVMSRADFRKPHKVKQNRGVYKYIVLIQGSRINDNS